MSLTNNGLLSQASCKVLSGHGMLPGWLFLLLAFSLAFASPARAGFADSIADSLTDPGAIEEKCRKGETSLCTSAGNMYRHGHKVAKDMDRAVEFYRLGCSGGDSKSCYALYQIGYDASRGKGTKPNMPRAVQLFTTACEGATSGKYSAPACHELARLHLEGKSVSKDVDRGVELLRRGCAGFSRRACRDLGNILLEGALISRDVPGALAAYRTGCDGKDKDSKACAQLGLLLFKGEQVERDIPAAAGYLTDGCTFPDWIGTACYELALLYETELPGKKSEEEIYKLYRVACDQADSERVGIACVAAADRHLQGKGAKKDPNSVSHLYGLGCRLNYRESCRLSCEWHCKEGHPHACAAIKTGRIPLGVAGCIKL